MKRNLMRLAALLGLSAGLSRPAAAQGSYTDDALLFSRQGPAGTARTLGLGGANVAVGGDWASAALNPAGLGVFTKSEVTFTPGLGFGQTGATPLATPATLGTPPTINQNNSRFQVASAGVVFTTRRADNDNSSDWRGGSFALGLTRMADFNQSFRYQNQTRDDNSFFQYLREPGRNANFLSQPYQDAVQDIVNQENRQQFQTLDGLGYGLGLTDINNVRVNNVNFGRVSTPRRTDPITQDESQTSTGSLVQYDLAYGGNYRDRLYLGVGVGFTSLTRNRTATFAETSGGVQDFTFTDVVNTSGLGVNARVGAIYRAADALRLGVSVQTPTVLSMQDNYQTTMTVDRQRYLVTAGITGSNTASTVPGTYDYRLTTPFRANGGVMVLLNKYGFLTGDVEYVNYGAASFGTVETNAGGGDFAFTNSNIERTFRRAVNLRVGAEGRFEIFRVRLGYARYANPFQATLGQDLTQNYFTGGVGIRSSSFFLDMAAVYNTGREVYSPYNLLNAPAPVIVFDRTRTTVSLTGGLVF